MRKETGREYNVIYAPTSAKASLAGGAIIINGAMNNHSSAFGPGGELAAWQEQGRLSGF
jgi:hypothetical protein